MKVPDSDSDAIDEEVETPFVVSEWLSFWRLKLPLELPELELVLLWVAV